MKCIKSFGFLAAAAALMVFAGPASATVTSPAGTAYTGPVHLASTNYSLDGSVKIACTAVTTNISINGGSTTGVVNTMAFSGCGTDTVTTLSKGTLAIASNGAVTSTGLEVTWQMHRTVLGFPVTTHCIYKTNNTGVGTLTEGVAPAKLHVGASPIPEVPTDSACGTDAVWTGTYTASNPVSAIIVD